jgi:pyruvate,water dikinase
MVGKKAKKYFQENFKIEVSRLGQINELKGTVSCAGKTKGRVTIVNMPGDMKEMEEGDILVSFATNPNLMPAIRKAGGIVTDEGGLTCHAAIVSRELRIPCVVGTKIATKVLKNGDWVEMNAINGTIKLIK